MTPLCVPLAKAAGPALALVFMGADGDIERARVALAATKPWSDAPQAAWRLQPAKPPCWIQTKDLIAPTLRCGPALSEAVKACGVERAKVIVLDARPFTSRAPVAGPGETSAVFVSTARAGWEDDLLHELGHAFALRDERERLSVTRKQESVGPGPNCAATEDEARHRWGDLLAAGRAGLHRGCAGHADWFRPHEATRMGDPRAGAAAGYGEASERYLRAAVRCCFLRDAALCSAEAARHPEISVCR